MYAYSKKEIIKVEKNLDVIYGAFSEEKKNGLNLLHDHLKNQLTVSKPINLNKVFIKLHTK